MKRFAEGRATAQHVNGCSWQMRQEWERALKSALLVVECFQKHGMNRSWVCHRRIRWWGWQRQGRFGRWRWRRRCTEQLRFWLLHRWTTFTSLRTFVQWQIKRLFRCGWCFLILKNKLLDFHCRENRKNIDILSNICTFSSASDIFRCFGGELCSESEFSVFNFVSFFMVNSSMLKKDFERVRQRAGDRCGPFRM